MRIGGRVYVDTTVFMYAMGAKSHFKEPCARILRAGVAAEAALVTSAETLQEVLHRYRCIGRQSDIKPTFEAIAAAVARRQGLREILTVDAGFSTIPGIVVVDPLEWLVEQPQR